MSNVKVATLSNGLRIAVDEMPEVESASLGIWVACGTEMMPRVGIPPEVERITLAGDNGDAGRRAVDLATAAFMKDGIAVNAIYPDAEFKAWNDQLRGVRI